MLLKVRTSARVVVMGMVMARVRVRFRVGPRIAVRVSVSVIVVSVIVRVLSLAFGSGILLGPDPALIALESNGPWTRARVPSSVLSGLEMHRFVLTVVSENAFTHGLLRYNYLGTSTPHLHLISVEL